MICQIKDVKAPNGKPSILYKDLTEFHNGNEDNAFKDYIKTERLSFKEWVQGKEIYQGEKARDENNEVTIKLLQAYNNIFTSPTITETTQSFTGSENIYKQELTYELDDKGNELPYHNLNGKKINRISSVVESLTPDYEKFDLQKKADKEWEGLKPEDPKDVYNTLLKQYDSYKNKEEYIKVNQNRKRLSQIDGRVVTPILKQIYGKWIGNVDMVNEGIKEESIETNKIILEGIDTKTTKRMQHLEFKSNDGTGRYTTTVMLSNMGISATTGKYEEGISDDLQFEVPLAIDILGIGGHTDLIARHNDGTSTFVELKSGRIIANESDESLSNAILKYGKTKNGVIEATQLNKAKLQLTLYMVMAKYNDPTLLIRDSYVGLINSYHAMLRNNKDARNHNVAAFLELIESAFNDKNFIAELQKGTEVQIPSNVVQELKKKSPNIFNPLDYTRGLTADSLEKDIQDTMTNSMDTEHTTDYLKDKYIKQLAGIQDKLNDIKNDPYHKDGKLVPALNRQSRDITTKLLLLTGQKLDIQKRIVDEQEFLMSRLDESKMLGSWEGYFASLQEFELPELKAFQVYKDENGNRADKLYRLRMSKFQELGNKLQKEWGKENNVPVGRILKNLVYSTHNGKGLYDFATVKEKVGGSAVDNRKRLIVAYKSDDKIMESKNKDNYTLIGNYYVKNEDVPVWNSSKMTQTKKDWIIEANYLSSYYFKDRGDNIAYLNQPYQSNIDGDESKDKTLLQKYNDKDSGRHFEYYEGWFPKIWEQPEELEYKTGHKILGGEGTGVLNNIIGWAAYPFINFKEWFNRRFTRYLDYNYEDYDNLGSGLPLKYLGNSRMDEQFLYSDNLGLAFNAFVKNIEWKKQMDNIYILSKGLKSVVEMAQHQSNNPILKNELEYLRRTVPYELTGLKIEELTNEKLLKENKVSFGSSRVYKIDWLKVLKGLQSWSTRSMMAGRFKQGIGNAMHSSLITYQNAIKDSIAKRAFAGITGNEIDFTTTDLQFGINEYRKLVGDYMKGTHTNNKLWLLARDMRYLPEDYNFTVPYDMQVSVRNKLWDVNNWAYIFQSLPDDAMSYIVLAAQLHGMKHTKDKYTEEDIQKYGKSLFKPKVGESKSIYDSYTTDGKGNVNWSGSTRGVIEIAPNTYEPINELSSREIRRLKEVYKGMQGAYRMDEVSVFGSTVIGELMMSLKKWLPVMLRRQFGGLRYKEELGYYGYTYEDIQTELNQLKVRTVSGIKEPVLEWKARTAEGRITTLRKLFVFYASLGRYTQSHEWKKLTNDQKKNILELGINFAMYLSFILLWKWKYDDEPDDDTMKKWWRQYAIDNPSQIWNVSDMARTLETAMSPVVVTKLSKAITNTAGYVTHVMGAGLGMNELRNEKGNIPYQSKVLDIFVYPAMVNQWYKDAQSDKTLFSDNPFKTLK
jgi:hypothetical protein